MDIMDSVKNIMNKQSSTVNSWINSLIIFSIIIIEVEIFKTAGSGLIIIL